MLNIFYHCTSLTSVIIPDGVTSIGSEAFQGCRGLTSIIIGSSMATIAESAFQGCSSLTNVYCYAENVPETASDAFDGSAYRNATLRVPYASIGEYQNTEPWRNFTHISGPKCATPTILFANGRLTFECATEGVEFRATIQPMGDQTVTASTLFLADLPIRYHVFVSAEKEGYEPSDNATLNISNPMKRGDINRDGSVTIADALKIVERVLE